MQEECNEALNLAEALNTEYFNVFIAIFNRMNVSKLDQMHFIPADLSRIPSSDEHLKNYTSNK